jgi:5-methylcytosine-specific restriction endonuclease McrA
VISDESGYPRPAAPSPLLRQGRPMPSRPGRRPKLVSNDPRATACISCEMPHFPTRRGRCKACARHFRLYGAERGPFLQPKCSRCGELGTEALGLCRTCYSWRRKWGIDRPMEHIQRPLLAALNVRRCARCRRLKHTDQFCRSRRDAATLQSECRECHRLRGLQATADNPAKPHPRVCAGCGKAYLAHPNAPFSRFCTKRYALMRGARRAERVDRKTIFLRDGWVCQLCRKKVNPKLPSTHRFGATLDHIIPVSRGGEHTPANLQLAHLACNSRKKDRSAGEQLRLIG